MIEFFEVMFRALTGLKLTMPNLIGIFGVFIAGYYFAYTTKRLSLIKAFFVLILGYWISTVLNALFGVYTLAFILGFLSNTGFFILRILLWVDNLREFWFFLQNRTVAEDTYKSEDTSQYKKQESSKQETKQEKAQQKSQKTSSSKSQSSNTNAKPEIDDWKPSDIYKPDDFKKCMEILGLQAPFTQKEIKKAYRRMAMRFHPDVQGTGDQKKFVLGTAAYEYLERHYGKYSL